MLCVALSALTGTVGAGVALGQTPPGDPMDLQRNVQRADEARAAPMGDQKLSDAEKDTIRKLHQANQVEVELGQIARSNAGSRAVKDYGEMLSRDHQAADDKVVLLAGQYSVELREPTDKNLQQDKADRQTIERLRHKKGAAFDQDFLQTMVTGHDKTIDAVQSWQAKFDDPRLKTLLDDMMPHLKMHRDRAAALMKDSNPGTP
jgi:putative membrane protein